MGAELPLSVLSSVTLHFQIVAGKKEGVATYHIDPAFKNNLGGFLWFISFIGSTLVYLASPFISKGGNHLTKNPQTKESPLLER